MTKVFKLSELDNAVVNPSGSKDYFLFMLGTDTQFTPEPTKHSKDAKVKKTYENGETLSYAAQVVAERLGEDKLKRDINSPVSFSTPSVDVIDGPTTLGSEVGDRIARGVFLILQAVLSGKSTIQISAHSRGAVESILIAHEIQRIKELLADKPNVKLYDVLVTSPCSYTKAAFQVLFKKEQNNKFTKFDSKFLSERLDKAKINLFLMDPVPGDAAYQIAGGWNDPRFYKKIPCHSVELMLFRDERTRCFIPIVPDEITPIIIPGHHGTASGNLYTQQLEELPSSIKNRDTSSVQKLVVYSLLQFIHSSSNVFENNREQESVNLKHDELDKITNEFIRSNSQKSRSIQLLALYSEVQKNTLAFKHFANTYYTYWLGQLNSVMGNRFVHYRGHNHVDLSTLGSLEGQFVNREHALIYLREILGFTINDTHASFDQIIGPLTTSFDTLFTQYVDNEGNVADLLNNAVTRKEAFNAISSVIENISQIYLRNHLSNDVKLNLMNDIRSIFKVLGKHQGEDNKKLIYEFVEESKTILKTAIKTTTETQSKSLIEQSNRLFEEIKLLPFSSKKHFNTSVLNYIKLLEEGSNQYEQFKSIIQNLKQIDLTSSDSVSLIINEAINELGKIEDNKEAVNRLIDLMDDQHSNLNTCFKARTLDKKVILDDLNRLYENISSLIDGRESILKIISPLQLDILTSELSLHQLRAVNLAANIFVKKPKFLEDKAENLNLSKDFFEMVKKHAIALGANHPELTEALELNEFFKHHLIEFQKQMMVLESNLKESDNHLVQTNQKIIEQDAQLQEKNKQIDKQSDDMMSLNLKNNHLTEQLNQQMELVNIEKQLLEKEKEAHRLDSEKVIELDKKLGSLQQAYEVLQTSLETIQQELSGSKQTNSDLNKELSANKETVVHLEAESKQQKKTLEHQEVTVKKALADIRTINKKLSVKQETVDKLQNESKQQKETLSRQEIKLKQDLVDIQTLKNELNEKQEMVVQLQAESKQQKQTIDHQEFKLKQNLADIQTLKKESNEKQETVVQLQADFKQQKKTIELQEFKLKQNLEDIQALNKKLSAKQETVDKLQNNIKKQNETFNRQEIQLKLDLNEIQNLKKELSASQDTVVKLQDESNQQKETLNRQEIKLKQDLDDIQKLNTELSAHQETIVKLQVESKQQKEMLERQESELKQDLDDIQNLNTELSAHQEAVVKLQAESNQQKETLEHQEIQLKHDLDDIQTLNKELSANKETVVKLQAESKQQKETIERQELKQKHDVGQIQKLNKELSENEETVLQLKDDFKKQKETLQKQDSTLKQNSAQIQNLNKKLSANQETILKLTNESTQQKDTLQRKDKELKQNSVQIHKTLEDNQKLIQQKEKLETKNASIQNELQLKTKELLTVQSKMNEQEKSLQELNASNKKLQELLQEASNKELDTNATANVQTQTLKEREEIIQKLNSSEEIVCASLIQTKLLPYTLTYLQHLEDQANQYKSTDPEYKEYSGKISEKINYVMALRDCLTNSVQNKLPTERVKAFATELNNHKKELMEHRDSHWIRYSRNCLIAIGIVCTGIIPGLIAMIGYSRYMGESPLFFAQSQGTRFVEHVHPDLPEINVSN